MRPVVSPLAAAMVWAPMLTSPALSAGADFSGKTITVLVGYAVGGPVDGFARLVASRLGAYLPGRPTVIVQSKPGAGGVVAANYLYSAAPKDGSMLLVTIAPFTNQYIDAREIRFATDRFYWLGALNYSNAIYVHSSLGIHSPADIMKARTQIVVGGLSQNSSRDLYMNTFLEAVGYKNYKYVKGYQGTIEVRTALLRQEVNFSTESVVALTTELASSVKDGSVVPLVQSGLTRGGNVVRDPALANIPTAEEAVVGVRGADSRKTVEFHGMNLVISMFALGRAIISPPGVDPAAGAALREAVSRLDADPDFQKAATNLNGGIKMELTDGATAQTFAEDVAHLAKSDQTALHYLEDMAQRK